MRQNIFVGQREGREPKKTAKLRQNEIVTKAKDGIHDFLKRKKERDRLRKPKWRETVDNSFEPETLEATEKAEKDDGYRTGDGWRQKARVHGTGIHTEKPSQKIPLDIKQPKISFEHGGHTHSIKQGQGIQPHHPDIPGSKKYSHAGHTELPARDSKKPEPNQETFTQEEADKPTIKKMLMKAFGSKKIDDFIKKHPKAKAEFEKKKAEGEAAVRAKAEKMVQLPPKARSDYHYDQMADDDAERQRQDAEDTQKVTPREKERNEVIEDLYYRGKVNIEPKRPKELDKGEYDELLELALMARLDFIMKDVFSSMLPVDEEKEKIRREGERRAKLREKNRLKPVKVGPDVSSHGAKRFRDKEERRIRAQLKQQKVKNELGEEKKKDRKLKHQYAGVLTPEQKKKFIPSGKVGSKVYPELPGEGIKRFQRERAKEDAWLDRKGGPDRFGVYRDPGPHFYQEDVMSRDYPKVPSEEAGTQEAVPYKKLPEDDQRRGPRMSPSMEGKLHASPSPEYLANLKRKQDKNLNASENSGTDIEDFSFLWKVKEIREIYYKSLPMPFLLELYKVEGKYPGYKKEKSGLYSIDTPPKSEEHWEKEKAARDKRIAEDDSKPIKRIPGTTVEREH
jgi:hypothetical protein